MSFLVDTNVLSELRKPKPNRGVLDWFETVDGHELFLSVLTIGEIRRGITGLEQRGDRAQANALESWLAHILDHYDNHIAVVDGAVAQEWGRIKPAQPVPVIDGLLAATAIVHGWVLATRNTADIARTRARLHNPFTAT